MFLIKGEMLVNSREYAGTMLKAGEFMLQPISSKIEMLAMTDVECIYYQFNQPELFCDIRYNRIMKETDPPLIPSPLPIIPELQHFLESARTYLSEKKICRDLLSLKRKELAFILGYFIRIMTWLPWYILSLNMLLRLSALYIRTIRR